MTSAPRLHLFDAVGIEIEYMIVDGASFDVRPVADELFRAVLGAEGSDVEGDVISWSNELVAHVVELKTSLPVQSIESTVEPFMAEVRRVQSYLDPMGCRLLPTAMHPWMNPASETRLWPGENNEIYAAFDRIFNCQGHGWSNLQSMHLNLPFSGDEEFARLHAAIRLVLPLIPALAASSPFEEGKTTGFVDNRMKHYLRNTARLPSVSGLIVPEPVVSESDYRKHIFEPMFREIAPFDPTGMMQDEWLNARGAIARFGRGSIEIRVIDSQECVLADLAIAAAIVAAVRALVEERWCRFEEQIRVSQDELVGGLHRSIRFGSESPLAESAFRQCWGDTSATTMGELWRHVIRELTGEQSGIHACWKSTLETIVRRGTLAEYLLRRAGDASGRKSLRDIYAEIADSLLSNTLLTDRD